MRQPLIVQLTAVISLCFSTLCVADDLPKPSDADLKFFESRIRPLLIEKCGKCHGAEKQESNLRIDSLGGLLQGGDAGPSVVPKQPSKSLLLTAVNYQDSDLKMPPDKKLSDAEIADLKKWIDLGAPHPDMLTMKTTITPRKGKVDFVEARKFWSYQPVQRPAPPTVKNAAWSITDIDRFVLAKIEEHGLTPNRPADRRALLRRAALDLTGLPPTEADLAAFLNDESPQAWLRAIDRLLESPHYGERWGRHWLDVARYADSNGLDENIAHGNAWRYRDWVINAFNRDVPYDEFLTMQVAGDLLPFDETTPEGRQARNERLIATGFLAIGPKVLAEVDETKMEMDIIDEQIDTLGRAALGMTFGCARCHDHKFDPVTAADYYALAGIFKSTRTMEHFKKIARWQENPVPTDQDLTAKRELDAKVAQQKAAIEEQLAQAKTKWLANQPADTKVPADVEKQFPEETKKSLTAAREQLKKLETDAANLIPTAMGAIEGKVSDLAVHLRGSHLTLGDVSPRRMPEVFAPLDNPQLPADHSGRLELAKWLTNPRHPLTARVVVNRVWRWHFGQGLVRSPDNFGKLGEAPTHPELLDWLADEFVRSGWSFKNLHRLILRSAVYQQASDLPSINPSSVDPENVWLARFPLRRMDAEVLRDSVLAVSGLLDRTMGGSLLHVKNREFFFDHTSKDLTKYDSLKRTVYLPVVRNNLYDVFQLFDATDSTVSNGDRNSSTVAPQALFLMNSDLVQDAANGLAQRLLAMSEKDDAARLDQLYVAAYGRPASDSETTRLMGFINRSIAANAESSDAAAKRLAAWRAVCHVVLTSNEFLYIK